MNAENETKMEGVISLPYFIFDAMWQYIYSYRSDLFNMAKDQSQSASNQKLVELKLAVQTILM